MHGRFRKSDPGDGVFDNVSEKVAEIKAKAVNRIVNGKDSDIKKHPWTVLLTIKPT